MIEKSLENNVHIDELYTLSHRHDNELHNAVDYKTNLLQNSLSRNIYKNDNVNGFLNFLQPMVTHMIVTTSFIRNYYNWTVSKYYDRHSN